VTQAIAHPVGAPGRRSCPALIGCWLLADWTPIEADGFGPGPGDLGSRPPLAPGRFRDVDFGAASIVLESGLSNGRTLAGVWSSAPSPAT